MAPRGSRPRAPDRPGSRTLRPGLPGSYVLWLQVSGTVGCSLGSGVALRLPRGAYCYIGSARSGLYARVSRHLNRAAGPPHPLLFRLAALAGCRLAALRPKRCRWQVDYLLEQPQVSVRAVTLLPMAAAECAVVALLRGSAGAALPLPGFGASDCKSGCGAHLLALPLRRQGHARRLLRAQWPACHLHARGGGDPGGP